MAARYLVLLRHKRLLLCIAGVVTFTTLFWLHNKLSFSMTNQKFPTADRFNRKIKVSERQCNSKQDLLFDEFFQSEQVLEFMDKYRENCRTYYTSPLPFVSLLGHSGVLTPDRTLGFGSFINNAANVYMATTEPKVKGHWRFQFVIHGWKYESLSSIFTDFASDTPCALFRDISAEEYDRLYETRGDYTAKYEDESLNIIGSKPAMVVTLTDEFVALRHELEKVADRVGNDSFFAEKSLFIKFLWQPQPLLKELIRILRTALLDENQRFFAIHIRRSDKLWVEAKDIPIREFSDKIVQICMNDTKTCPKNIFVMYDEESAFDELENALRGSFQVFDLARLVKYVGLTVSDYVVTSDSVNSLKHWLSASRRGFWRPHTKQLVMEITLLAMADQLVCTYSSNICRLVALLRGDHRKGVHSLDDPWYPCGGKDSCYNMMCAVADGHEVVALANLQPFDADELDSYMYQTVGHQAIEYQAKAMNLPLYRRFIQGKAGLLTQEYEPTIDDEVEDLYELLRDMKKTVDFQGVSVGAIMSEYQTRRVINVCQRLELTPLAYLWQRNQRELIQEMVSVNLDAILIKVAAIGLNPEKHLGRPIAELIPYLFQLEDKYGSNVCGEGGEYETLTLDCPLYHQKLFIDSAETVMVDSNTVAPVAYLNPVAISLERKTVFDSVKSQRELIQPFMHVFIGALAKYVPASFP